MKVSVQREWFSSCWVPLFVNQGAQLKKGWAAFPASRVGYNHDPEMWEWLSPKVVKYLQQRNTEKEARGKGARGRGLGILRAADGGRRTGRSSEAGSPVWIDQASYMRNVQKLFVCFARRSRGKFLCAFSKLESRGEAPSRPFGGSTAVWCEGRRRASSAEAILGFSFQTTPL